MPDCFPVAVTTSKDDDILEQIEKQVGKLVDVRDIKELDPDDSVYRELVLVKVKVDPEKRLEIRQGVEFLANNFRAKIIDVGAENLIVEFTGNHSKVNALIQRFTEEYGVILLLKGASTVICGSVGACQNRYHRSGKRYRERYLY